MRVSLSAALFVLGSSSYLILIRVSFHRAKELRISVFIRGPRRHDTPEVKLSVVADFSHNDFYLAPINNGDDTPVLYGFAFADALLVAFNLKLFECLLVFLIRGRELYELHRSRQELKAHYLRRTLAFAARALENNVVETLGGEMHVLVESGRRHRANSAVELSRIIAQFFVVGHVFHSGSLHRC